MSNNLKFDNTDDVLPKVKNTLYSKCIKRILDIALSGIAIIVLSPLFLIISILELRYHGKPVIYKTLRPGKDGKPFLLYKFRSMNNDLDADGNLLPGNQRITKFGRFLRRTSIDELAGLFNIFIGDMSIIGPRPLLVDYLDKYNARHKMRHSVRPGLACFPLKKSKDDILSDRWTWRDQFENDMYYIENVSFVVDVRMVGAVIGSVIKGRKERTEDTRTEFNGTNLDD